MNTEREDYGGANYKSISMGGAHFLANFLQPDYHQYNESGHSDITTANITSTFGMYDLRLAWKAEIYIVAFQEMYLVYIYITNYIYKFAWINRAT